LRTSAFASVCERSLLFPPTRLPNDCPAAPPKCRWLPLSCRKLVPATAWQAAQPFPGYRGCRPSYCHAGGAATAARSPGAAPNCSPVAAQFLPPVRSQQLSPLNIKYGIVLPHMSAHFRKCPRIRLKLRQTCCPAASRLPPGFRPATAELPPSYRPATAQLPPSYRQVTVQRVPSALSWPLPPPSYSRPLTGKLHLRCAPFPAQPLSYCPATARRCSA